MEGADDGVVVVADVAEVSMRSADGDAAFGGGGATSAAADVEDA